MTAYGWDLSNHDWARAQQVGRTVDLANARAAGISLVTHKATEGDFYEDPYFDNFARQLGAVQFPVAGSYHVLSGDIGIARQTDMWIDSVNGRWPAWRQHPCPIWQIDAEPLDGHPTPSKAEILACGQRLVAKLGIEPTQVVVYGPAWVYGDRLLGLPHHLWASNYVSGSGSFRALYPGDGSTRWGKYSGQTPVILQYSSSATIGDQHQCDVNAIRVDSPAELQSLFRRQSSAPATPPRKRPDMLVVQVDPTTVPSGKTVPGSWLLLHGEKLTRIPSPAGKPQVNNGNNVLAALGQAHVCPITYDFYVKLGGVS